jgi:hypothetical protein
VQEPQELARRQAAGHLLATHPEAQSLLAEASHRHALAEQSSAAAGRAFIVMQAARLGYEERQHRLDPRQTRTIHCGITLALLTATFAAWVMLGAIELTGVLSGWMAATAIPTAAVWTGCAWLAALAGRERQHGMLAATGVAAVTVAGLLAALHGYASQPDFRYRVGVGVVTALLILVLVAVAATLMARTEPVSLWVARRHWHAARAGHAAAVRLAHQDAEASIVAGQSWTSLVRAHAQERARAPEQGQALERAQTGARGRANGADRDQAGG